MRFSWSSSSIRASFESAGKGVAGEYALANPGDVELQAMCSSTGELERRRTEYEVSVATVGDLAGQTDRGGTRTTRVTDALDRGRHLRSADATRYGRVDDYSWRQL